MRTIPRIRPWLACMLSAVVGICHAARADDLLLVVGAGGTDEYAGMFDRWAGRWQTAAQERGMHVTTIGPNTEPGDDASLTSNREATNEGATDREQLLTAISVLGGEAADKTSTLWVVLIGHGTFQQGVANFNLVGPDVSAAMLAQGLERVERPVVVINTASSSGPFVAALSGPNRVIVTATRSGDEQNFARFGQYLSMAIGDQQADLDHDQQVSLLEAYLLASAETAKFYEEDDRLATEHALLDDNGDKLGTPADFFRGTRVVKQVQDDGTPDGQHASRLIVARFGELPELSPEDSQRVAELEQQLEKLRSQKPLLEANDYYQQVEQVVTRIAELEQPDAQLDE